MDNRPLAPPPQVWEAGKESPQWQASDTPRIGGGGAILATILAHKREEVAERKGRISLESLRDAASSQTITTWDFIGALKKPLNGRIALIAEVKKASPSAGVIRADFDPVQIAEIYDRNGADCISVLTDERFFQGHDDYLTAVQHAVALPTLRKDFVIDPYQIYEASLLHADAILLIAAALSAEQIAEYRTLARNLGMAALVEVHTEAEMETALDVGANLIGINSRDLNTFVTDLGVVERLAAMAPKSVTLVAESGIKTPADVKRVADAGANAILVGESLMRAPDIGAALRELMG